MKSTIFFRYTHFLTHKFRKYIIKLNKKDSTLTLPVPIPDEEKKLI